MSVQNGDLVLIQFGGVQVGALISNSHNMSADMLDKGSKDLPGVKQYDAGEDGWTLSVEALWDPAASEGFSEALGYLKAGTELTVLHGIPGSDAGSGTGLISSVDVSGPKNEISSYSLEIQGTGVWLAGLGPELHISANAASDPNANEADATTGWTPTGLTGTGANVFESQSAVKSTGGFAFHANTNDTPTADAKFRIDITVEAGATYRITRDVRHVGTGGNWKGFFDGTFGDTIPPTLLTFESRSDDFVAGDTTFTIQFSESSGANDGGIYLDNLSVRKVL